MIKRCDLAVYETIKSLVNQELKGGCREFDLRMFGVGYAENDYNKSLIEEIKPRLEEIKAKIISGEIKVPTNSTGRLLNYGLQIKGWENLCPGPEKKNLPET